MENLFAMIEGATSHEIASLEQIDQEKMPEFLSKLGIWDFYEMAREEYTSKSADDEKLLILKYYNHLLLGIFLSFVVWILFFLVWILFWFLCDGNYKNFISFCLGIIFCNVNCKIFTS